MSASTHVSTRSIVVLFAALVAMLVAGCGSNGSPANSMAPAVPPVQSTPTAVPLPTMLHVVAVGDPARPNIAAYDVSRTDAVAVQQLYATTLALPVPPHGQFCGNYRGGGYQITFLRGTTVVLQAFMPDGYCPRVLLTQPDGCREPTSQYQAQLGALLGMPLRRLVDDSAAPGEPTAPPHLAPDQPYAGFC